MSKNTFRNCKHCGSKVHNRVAVYCSNQCQADFAYELFIKKWLSKEIEGGVGIHALSISRHIRRYMSENYGKECMSCGWNQIHSVTGKVPLEIDHIDGDSNNNHVDNLRMICPNCHALTPNFRALNMGKGRAWRRDSYIKVRLSH
jgi:hypothetical protein